MDDKDQKLKTLNDVNDSETVITLSENLVTMRGEHSDLVSVLAASIAGHEEFRRVVGEAADLVNSHKKKKQ